MFSALTPLACLLWGDKEDLESGHFIFWQNSPDRVKGLVAKLTGVSDCESGAPLLSLSGIYWNALWLMNTFFFCFLFPTSATDEVRVEAFLCPSVHKTKTNIIFWLLKVSFLRCTLGEQNHKLTFHSRNLCQICQHYPQTSLNVLCGVTFPFHCHKPVIKHNMAHQICSHWQSFLSFTSGLWFQTPMMLFTSTSGLLSRGVEL